MIKLPNDLILARNEQKDFNRNFLDNPDIPDTVPNTVFGYLGTAFNKVKIDIA
jgi:hypothetical protein